MMKEKQAVSVGGGLALLMWLGAWAGSGYFFAKGARHVAATGQPNGAVMAWLVACALLVDPVPTSSHEHGWNSLSSQRTAWP